MRRLERRKAGQVAPAASTKGLSQCWTEGSHVEGEGEGLEGGHARASTSMAFTSLRLSSTWSQVSRRACRHGSEESANRVVEHMAWCVAAGYASCRAPI